MYKTILTAVVASLISSATIAGEVTQRISPSGEQFTQYTADNGEKVNFSHKYDNYRIRPLEGGTYKHDDLHPIASQFFDNNGDIESFVNLINETDETLDALNAPNLAVAEAKQRIMDFVEEFHGAINGLAHLNITGNTEDGYNVAVVGLQTLGVSSSATEDLKSLLEADLARAITDARAWDHNKVDDHLEDAREVAEAYLAYGDHNYIDAHVNAIEVRLDRLDAIIEVLHNGYLMDYSDHIRSILDEITTEEELDAFANEHLGLDPNGFKAQVVDAVARI